MADLHFFDASGFEWVYSPRQHRVYMVEAEDEMRVELGIPEGWPVKQNGYPAHDAEQALMAVQDMMG